MRLIKILPVPFRLLLLAFVSCPLAIAAEPSVRVSALIYRAGNADDDVERRAALQEIASLPDADADAALRADAAKLADFVRRWTDGGLKFYNAQNRGKKKEEQVNYDFALSAASPLQPLTDIYLGRIIAWNLIEDSTVRSSPELGPLYKRTSLAAFQRYSNAFPQNRIARMYLGETIPWTKAYPIVPGAPEWAVLQREQLDRLTDIIVWWIDHRQKPDAQFGGGWGDDCEMWRWWSSVLLGFDHPKIREAQLKFSRAAVDRPHLVGGFNTEITDVEHAAEDTTDNLVPLIALEPDNPRWEKWALKLGDFTRDVWTGRNERGQLQFKSFFFSATATSPAPARALDVIADIGALHPALLAWQKTGDAKIGAVLTDWLDTWVDATARAENGKPAGILPASIRWPDGQAAGADGHWWEPVKLGGFMHSYYIWPSVITELTDALVLAYLSTQNEKYLAPIRSMAAIRLRALKNPPATAPAAGTESWCGLQLAPRPNANSNTGGLVKTIARLKALTGTREFDELLALEGTEFVIRTDAAGRRELEAALRESAGALRVNFPGFTSEVRSTDRVMRFVQFFAQDYQFDAYKGVTQPKHELLYRMVTGDKNAPRFPQMAVRWLTPPEDIAALVTEASTTRLTAELFHFGPGARTMSAQLRQLKPGRYHVRLDAEGHIQRQSLTVEPGRFPSINFTLTPQTLCNLSVTPVQTN